MIIFFKIPSKGSVNSDALFISPKGMVMQLFFAKDKHMSVTSMQFFYTIIDSHNDIKAFYFLRYDRIVGNVWQ